MKTIITSKGHNILVDDADYNWLSAYRWHVKGNGYAVMNYGGSLRLQKSMHRLIMGLTDSKIMVDHKDRNKLNNTRSNLRVADSVQNGRNRSKTKQCTSKYKGVSLFKRDNKWISHIKIDGKTRHIGVFETEKEAAIAYDNIAIKLHGHFANLNFQYCEHSKYYFRLVVFNYEQEPRTSLQKDEDLQILSAQIGDSLWPMWMPLAG